MVNLCPKKWTLPGFIFDRDFYILYFGQFSGQKPGFWSILSKKVGREKWLKNDKKGRFWGVFGTFWGVLKHF
jgi:hypothetical protein